MSQQAGRRRNRQEIKNQQQQQQQQRRAAQNKLRKRQQAARLDTRRPSVRIRRACSKPLRNVLFHAAAAATIYSAFYKTRDKKYRQKGHTHGRACRQIGDHLLRILVGMLKSRQPIDPSRFDNEHAEA